MFATHPNDKVPFVVFNMYIIGHVKPTGQFYTLPLGGGEGREPLRGYVIRKHYAYVHAPVGLSIRPGDRGRGPGVGAF